MNVVLAIEELNQIYGGVERTVCNLANFLNRAGHGVTILTFEQPSSSSPAYDIAPGVQRLDLGLINSQYERTRTARRSGIKARIPAFATGLIRN